MTEIVFHWRCGHASKLGSRSLWSVSGGDWMSILGHVGAAADTVYLITRCLLSAGWLMGRIPLFPPWSRSSNSPRTHTAYAIPRKQA